MTSAAAFLDSACICKICNHRLARKCVQEGCTCCTKEDHAMVLDGIEGFATDIEKSGNLTAGSVQTVNIPLDKGIALQGHIVYDTSRMVLFVHGSGSSRHSPRNRFVANLLNKAGIGTLLFDLLTEEEEIVDEQNRQYRFDIDLLTNRLLAVTDWLQSQRLPSPKIGYFGASTGAAAALIAAAERPGVVRSIVSRGGRPDLAGESLAKVRAPTLFLVGQKDDPVIELNREAFDELRLLGDDEKKLAIVHGATHLFEEPGKLEQVAHHATGWFTRFLDYEAKDNLSRDEPAARRTEST